MKLDFPYPLPEAALEEFCHPAAVLPFARPVRVESEIVAGNGYVMVRCHRGRWLDSEFPPASPELLARLGRIPWARYQLIPDFSWRDLAEVRGLIDRRGNLGFWKSGTARVNPSPVWRVGSVMVRLSLLQLIARLPRVAVAWTGDADSPLWFRFAGGRGAIAHDRRLTLASFEIFQPVRDVLTGLEVRRDTRAKPSFSLPGWPPVDHSDV